MTYESDYNHLLPQWQSLSENKVQKPNIPVEVAAREGEKLCRWTQSDKEVLVEHGLNWSLVESLPQRARALRQAEANWHRVMARHKNAHQTWETESLKGLELRQFLVRHFRYAFAELPDARIQLKTAVKGNRHSQLVQSLNNLAVMGEYYPAELDAVQFKKEHLEQARNMSKLLGHLLAVYRSKSNYHPALSIRNRAYTYLQMAVTDIRKCGRFCFHEKPNRLPGYASPIRRLEGKTKALEKSKALQNVIPLAKAAPMLPRTGTGT